MHGSSPPGSTRSEAILPVSSYWSKNHAKVQPNLPSADCSVRMPCNNSRGSVNMSEGVSSAQQLWLLNRQTHSIRGSLRMTSRRLALLFAVLVGLAAAAFPRPDLLMDAAPTDKSAQSNDAFAICAEADKLLRAGKAKEARTALEALSRDQTVKQSPARSRSLSARLRLFLTQGLRRCRAVAKPTGACTSSRSLAFTLIT